MSQKNNNFFQVKKEWSKTKDEILGKYLRPYFQKLISKKIDICYIDCFAGKGKFDDGMDGSPFIALNCIESALNSSRFNTKIHSYFIELNHHRDLKNNLENSNFKLEYNVVSGKFEDNIDLILKKHFDNTIFLYVDPYGIKAIDVNKFNSFKTNDRKSVELLINFNTWGFMREACRVLKADFKLDLKLDKYLVEYNPNNDLSRDELSKIAGSDFWIEIVEKYKNGQISSDEAELYLSKGIAINFRKKYKYVLNVPINSSDDAKIPKYRLFYLTNHEHGCLLMADTMYSAIDEARIKNRNGQQSFFEYDTEGYFSTDSDVKKIILDSLKKENERIDLFICRLLVDKGLIRGTKGLRNILKDLEKNNEIIITREPKYTATGKICTAMAEEKGRRIFVRRK